MKKQAYSLFVITGLLLAASAMPAYGRTARLVAANIPFNFVVKDKALPAGEYTLEQVDVGGTDALKIQSADGRITAIVPARESGSKREAVSINGHRSSIRPPAERVIKRAY